MTFVLLRYAVRVKGKVRTVLPTRRETKQRRRKTLRRYERWLISAVLFLVSATFVPSPPPRPVWLEEKTVRRAVTDVLHCLFSAWKEEDEKKKNPHIMSCPPHVCSLFRATEVSAPLHWFTHTLSLSVALCASLQVNSRMQMSTSSFFLFLFFSFLQGAGQLHEACTVCVCVCESCWPWGWEGSDRGLDMLKRQSKWVFLKQWRKYHRFMPGQFMSPYLFLKHVTLATAEW